jgi:hypothetical protein
VREGSDPDERGDEHDSRSGRGQLLDPAVASRRVALPRVARWLAEASRRIGGAGRGFDLRCFSLRSAERSESAPQRQTCRGRVI